MASSRKLDASSKASKIVELSLAQAVSETSLETDTTGWEIDPKEIKLSEKIGRGAFGTVYKAKLRGKEVAVKKLNVQDLDEEALESFRKEVAIMRYCHCFFFCKFYIRISFYPPIDRLSLTLDSKS